MTRQDAERIVFRSTNASMNVVESLTDKEVKYMAKKVIKLEKKEAKILKKEAKAEAKRLRKLGRCR